LGAKNVEKVQIRRIGKAVRPFESLLLLANLVTFLTLALPRAMRWARHLAVIAPPLAVTQALAEDPRWEMAPAYSLTGLFFLVWLFQTLAPADAVRRRTSNLVRALGIVIAIAGLAAAIASPLILPIFHFPKPSGPYGIGTLTYHFVDRSRPEIFSKDPGARRELMVQIWYPAKESPSSLRAAYMPDADALTAVIAHIHDRPAFLFGHFKYVTTNAMVSAPVADDQPSFPVLQFLEGATGYRQMNTFEVEELVSHGYIVAALDQPGAAANVVFPDGHEVAGLSLDQMPLIRQSYLPGEVAPILNGRAFENGIITYLAQDVLFTLDQLAGLNQSDPNGILTGKLDMRRMGTFGISLGGIVVGEACRLEPRLSACLMMDAPMAASVVQAGLQQPGMWITRDAASMRLERERAGGWPEAEIEAHLTSMRAVYGSLTGAGYFVQVPGMFHSNFLDVPLWSPLAPMIGLTGPIDGRRAHEIINAYSLAFFDRHLQGKSAALLDGPATQYPEVLFESRGR
jgi:predicted dienelactone hydrolase